MVGPHNIMKYLSLARLAVSLALAAAVWSAPASAQNIQRIAAVVNDEVISAYDLEQRVSLIVASTGVDASGEAGQRLRQQVLRSLIDEKLQLQEAKNFDVTADPKEVEETLAEIAKQNNFTVKELSETLKRSGVGINSLRDQIRAEHAWTDLVRRKFLSRISPGDEQVEAALARIEANAGKPEYQLAEIFLSVESPDDDEEVRRSALGMVEQLKAGAAFNAVARQFSQAATAATGGDLGWVQEGQLSAELDKEITSLAPGQISNPIRSSGGYYIMLVRDKRAAPGAGLKGTELDLRQIMLPYSVEKRLTINDPQPTDPIVAAALQRAQKIIDEAVTCPDMERIAKTLDKTARSDGGKVMLDDVPAVLRDAVANLPAGNISPPVLSPEGVYVVLVCSRTAQDSKLPPRDIVEARLNQEALSLRARRYLRDLRRDAVVEFR